MKSEINNIPYLSGSTAIVLVSVSDNESVSNTSFLISSLQVPVVANIGTSV